MIINTIADRYIDQYGETVSIKIKSSTTYSDWGDKMELSSTVTSKAMYNVYTEANLSNPEGYFKAGDKTFFFKQSETNVANGNIVIRTDGSTYEIEDVLDPGVYGNAYVYEAKVKRI